MAFVGFTISNIDGSLLVNANNRYQQSEIKIPANTPSVITCDLGMVPLMEGTYSVNLYLGDEGKDHHVVENAILFDVHERDIWGTGKTPPKRASNLWWNTNFQLSTDAKE